VVICGGTIEGTVVAKERVQLLAPSVLTGTVRSPLLIIEEGAQFNGTCEMKERGGTAKVVKRAGETSPEKAHG
jgi:cytoskeletal protein CcmA (bactofilin family)